jgi:hypothetical protein
MQGISNIKSDVWYLRWYVKSWLLPRYSYSNIGATGSDSSTVTIACPPFTLICARRNTAVGQSVNRFPANTNINIT